MMPSGRCDHTTVNTLFLCAFRGRILPKVVLLEGADSGRHVPGGRPLPRGFARMWSQHQREIIHRLENPGRPMSPHVLTCFLMDLMGQ
jgi:hypothetical protein